MTFKVETINLKVSLYNCKSCQESIIPSTFLWGSRCCKHCPGNVSQWQEYHWCLGSWWSLSGKKTSKVYGKLWKKNFKSHSLTFNKNLKWNTHVFNIIKKANSITYFLRALNHILPRSLHRQVIHSHFLSHLTYASPVWAVCLTVTELKRINTLGFKILRHHYFDYNRHLSKRELCARSNIRLFTSLKVINDTIMLHGLCRNPTNLELTVCLIQQPFFSPQITLKAIFLRRFNETNRTYKLCQS